MRITLKKRLVYSYLNREQYGSTPLIYGQYYTAGVDKRNPYSDGTPVYGKDEKSGKYIVSDDRKNSIPNFEKSQSGIFTRMWSRMIDMLRLTKLE